MLDSLLTLIQLMGFLAACAAIGECLLKALKLKLKGVENWLVRIGLGTGLYGILLFGLALVGGLYPWVAWGIVLLPLALYARASWRFSVSIPSVSWRRDGRLLWGALFTFAGFIIVMGLSPTIQLDMARNFLVDSATYARHHAFTPSFDFYMSWWPSHFVLLNSLFILLGNDLLVNLVNATTALLTAIAAGLWGYRVFSPRAGLWSAVLFLALPITQIMAGYGFRDCGMVYYFFMAIYAVQRAFEADDARWWWIAGLFGGFAAATKLYGLMVLPILVWILARSYSRQLGRFGAMLGITLFGSCVTCGHWYLRSWIETGNPVFPYYLDLFPTHQILREPFESIHAYSHQPGSTVDTQRGLLDIPRYLYRLLAHPTRFDIRMDYLIYILGSILLIYLLHMRQGDAHIRRLGEVCLLIFLMWFYGLPHKIFYCFALIPCLCLFIAALSTRISSTDPRFDRPLALGFAAVLLIFLVANLRRVQEPLKVAIGLETRDAFLSRELDLLCATDGLYEMSTYIRDHTPSGARVLFYHCSTGYYAKRDLFWCDFRLPQLSDMKDVQRFQRDLERHRISHVWRDMGKRGSDQVYLERWVELYGEPVHTEGLMKLYRVRSVPSRAEKTGSENVTLQILVLNNIFQPSTHVLGIHGDFAKRHLQSLKSTLS